MRDILVQSATSGDRLNRDCRVTEIMRQGDCLTTVTRRCTYRVEERVTMPSMDDTIRWAQRLDPLPPREVYLTKDLDPGTGQERITYKVRGHFYVVLEDEVFCVGYRHVLIMRVEPDDPYCDE